MHQHNGAVPIDKQTGDSWQPVTYISGLTDKERRCTQVHVDK